MEEQNTPEQEAPEQNQTNLNQPIHHRYWIPILVVAGLIVAYLALAGGYEWWPFSVPVAEKQEVSSKKQGDESPSTSLGTTGDDISSWQTYRNEEYGFEVSIPQNWTVETFNSNFELAFYSQKSREENKERESTKCTEQYIKNSETGAMECSQVSMDMYFISTNYSEGSNKYELINGIKWTVLEGQNSGLQYETEVQGKQYHFKLPLLPENREKMRLFLSTFKFIDSDADMSDWKTYRNEEFGFEVQLPNYWDGYQVNSRTLTTGGVSVGFDLPYTFNGEKTYYEDALQIIVYTKDQWASAEETDGSKPPKLSENDSYVFSYGIGRDLGGDGELERAGGDMDQILSTFKFIE